MKILLQIIFIIMFMLNLSFAGGEDNCDKLSLDKYCQKHNDRCANATILSIKVQSKLQNLERKFAAQGQELKAVFIGRMGTSPGSSLVLSDYHPKTKKILQSLNDYKSFAQKQISSQNKINDNNQGDSQLIRRELSKISSPDRKIRYSHFGIALKNHPKSPWLVTHLLRSCRNPMSNLHDENITAFFLDNPDDFGSQLIVPTTEIQDRIEKFILREKGGYFLMSSFYNLAAEWNNSKEQNSSNWPLEVIAAAQKPPNWFFNQLQAIVGSIDQEKILSDYAKLKEQQNKLTEKYNQLHHKWQIKYANYDFRNTTYQEHKKRKKLKENIKYLKNNLIKVTHELKPYYQIFTEGRRIAQNILKESNYRPTRILLKGVASLAKSFGPNYIKFHGDNGEHGLARVNTMLAFREYSERNNLIEKNITNGIIDIYLNPEERLKKKK